MTSSGLRRRVMVLGAEQLPGPPTDGVETIYVQSRASRPDLAIRYPDRYFEVDPDTDEVEGLTSSVLAWYEPDEVVGPPTTRAVADRVRAALAAPPAPREALPAPGPRPRTLLAHRHVADVLYGPDGPLLPHGVDFYYLSHNRGGLDVYDPDAFRRTWIIDYGDFDEVRVVVRWAVRHFGLDRLVTLHEKAISLVADLRAELGLPGLQPHQALAFRDKPTMKETISARTGLRVPRYRVIGSGADLAGFAAPPSGVVVKPVDGLGAEKTAWYPNAEAAREAWESSPPNGGRYEIEEFVPGAIFHVDSAVQDGKVVLAGVSEYLSPPMDIEPGGDLASVLHPESDLTERLRDANQEALSALGLEDGVGHAEFFVTPDDEIVFCEAAARPGGAGVDAVTRRALGLGMVGAALSLESGLTVRVPDHEPRTVGWLGFYPDPRRRGGLDPARFADLGIVEHKGNSFAGVVGGLPRHSVEFVDRYVIEAPDVDTLRAVVDEIRAEYWA